MIIKLIRTYFKKMKRGMNRMSDIIIKLGNTIINTSTEELKEVSETPDGVVFNLKGGLDILFSNQSMPSSTKQIIKNTADKMYGKKIIFELDNLRRPAMIIGD